MVLKKFPNRLLGEILVEEGFLDPDNLKKALELQKKEGGLIGEILLQMGWITEDELLMGLSKQLSLPFIRLSSYNINRNALKQLPREVAVRFLLIPFDFDNQLLSVAMLNPLDQDAIIQIEKSTPLSVQIFLAPSSEIKQAIEEHYTGSLAAEA